MRLDQLHSGQEARIVKILGHGAFRKRLIEMGFIKGREIKVLLHAPLHDPVKYSIMGYEVSLRLAEAHLVEVMPIGDTIEAATDRESGVPDQHGSTQRTGRTTNEDFERRRRTINIALIGNPNCGKTSLFNVASGAHEHVGNYSGVTVDAKVGTFQHKGYTFNIIDLPGTYSLACYSPEELYVRRYLREQTPDVIVNVVVSSNLERNLYLTTELIDMNRPMVIDLNMYDELEARGDRLDYKLLGEMIGVPIVPTVSRSGYGVSQLFDTMIDVFEDNEASVRHVHVALGNDIEPAVTAINDALKNEPKLEQKFSPRHIAIKLLERDKEAEEWLRHSVGQQKEREYLDLRDREVARIEKATGEDITSLIAAEKYGFIAGALAETYEKGNIDTQARTSIIDTLVTSPLFGFPIFLAIMIFIFWATFAIGSYPMEWIESLISWLSGLVNDNMADGPLKSLIADGILGGVGGVIVFLPNILILYFCISFMEDSGYMARAAFIMDRMMHKIGLHGKSFIPMLMGFGCSVPSIMATRTIESRSSRLITILITPFMSCSARLPIYVLLIGTFFSAHAALVFTGIYLMGVLVAIMTARLLRRFYFKTDVTPFVMELPPYRLPTMKASLRHMWAKGEQYLRKMGGIILIASICVWALNYFPLHDEVTEQEAITMTDDAAINPDRDSYLEMIGKAINPIMEPLGMHWRATVATVAGIPAKEIVVSTLGVLYTGDEEASDDTLSERITALNPSTGRPDFTPASALSFMIFVLLFCPCIATLTAIVRETGSWRYGAFSAIYSTVIAWIVAFAVYRIALLF